MKPKMFHPVRPTPAKIRHSRHELYSADVARRFGIAPGQSATRSYVLPVRQDDGGVDEVAELLIALLRATDTSKGH